MLFFYCFNVVASVVHLCGERPPTCRFIAANCHNIVVSSSQNYTKLIFTNYFIKCIPLNTGKIFPELKILIKTNSDIEKITNGSLHGLYKLEVLFLYRNNIKTIEEDSFKDLQSLRELRLSGNKIESVDDNLLKGLKNLTEIFLINSRIKTITSEAFSTNTKLEKIYIERNEIQNLEKNVFKELKELKFLNLSRNEISTIEFELFQNNRKLEIVDLSHNDIKQIEWATVAILQHLQMFNLTGKQCIDVVFNHSNICELKEQFKNCALVDVQKESGKAESSIELLFDYDQVDLNNDESADTLFKLPSQKVLVIAITVLTYLLIDVTLSFICVCRHL